VSRGHLPDPLPRRHTHTHTYTYAPLSLSLSLSLSIYIYIYIQGLRPGEYRKEKDPLCSFESDKFSLKHTNSLTVCVCVCVRVCVCMYMAHTHTDMPVVRQGAYLAVNKLFVKLCALLLLPLQQLHLHPERARTV